MQLFQGLASHVALPGKVELLIHEILGHVASCEGVVRAVRELKQRPGLMARGARLLPCAAGTCLPT